ncbi:hypothetical protein [Sphaerisporangium rhizosphaerae]|uniref:Uncharacterized protein n=1 Tax=Sphaerisporangium rhizosphaerae TaxID=2269375 RepID=A0ABW2PM23_9ACTN
MIERADQLVLEYVAKVADAAHGVLRTDQRLDFVQRLRARIEEERRGSEDPAAVRRVLARFGDPAVLLQREVARLTGAEPEPARRAAGVRRPGGVRGGRPGAVSRPSSLSPPSSLSRPAAGSTRPGSVRPGSPSSASSVSPQGGGPGPDGAEGPPVAPVEEAATSVFPPVPVSGPATGPVVGSAAGDEFGDSATEVLPAVVDDDRPVGPVRPPRPPRPPRPLPRGAAPGARRPVPRDAPAPLLRRFGRGAMAVPKAADGRDARTVLANDRRAVVGMALLLLSGLLVPFPLPSIAIFPVPVLVWALAALTVLSCDAWVFKDRMTGLFTPIMAYVVGGVLLGALRAPETPGDGFTAFVTSFWHVSGLMFMLGAAGGVAWLAYRLFNPPPPPPRRQTLGVLR